MMVRHIPGLTAVAALAVLVPGCASSKPAPEPEEERVVIEMPEEEGEPVEGAEGEVGDAELPAVDDSPIGIPACDTYIAKAMECGAEVPEPARAGYFAGLDQARASWRDIAKKEPAALEKGCLDALVATRDAMGPICPNVVWE